MKFSMYAIFPSVILAVSISMPVLDVQIMIQGNSVVKATITNHSNQSLQVRTEGDILSEMPIEKAIVSFDETGEPLRFQGLRVYLDDKDLETKNFQEISPGEHIEVTFNVAQVFDMSKGGIFSIQSKGRLQYTRGTGAGADLSDISTVNYISNMLRVHVDGMQALEVRKAWFAQHHRRWNTKNCQGSQLSAIQASVNHTLEMAIGAAKAAKDGPASKMEEYFKKSDSKTRDVVSGAFEKMAKLYSTDSGLPGLNCRDIRNYCSSSGVVAYCDASSADIVFCSKWFKNFEEINRKCRFVDQAHIGLHEATHLAQVKRTSDYKTYGYENSRKLSAEQNLNHADTYAYFAHDILAGC